MLHWRDEVSYLTSLYPHSRKVQQKLSRGISECKCSVCQMSVAGYICRALQQYVASDTQKSMSPRFWGSSMKTRTGWKVYGGGKRISASFVKRVISTYFKVMSPQNKGFRSCFIYHQSPHRKDISFTRSVLILDKGKALKQPVQKVCSVWCFAFRYSYFGFCYLSCKYITNCTSEGNLFLCWQGIQINFSSTQQFHRWLL